MTPNGTVASESDRRDHFKVRSWLIDGEVVCCDERGLARFDVLRRRRNEAVAVLYAFDLLELDGVDLRREPLEVRNPTLASILRKPRDGLRLKRAPRTPGGTRRVPARMRAGVRGNCLEAVGLALPQRSIAGLAQVQESGCAGGEA